MPAFYTENSDFNPPPKGTPLQSDIHTQADEQLLSIAATEEILITNLNLMKLESHIATGDFEFAADFADTLGMPDGNTSYQQLVALSHLERDDQMTSKITYSLESFPYNIEYHDAVRQLLEESNASDETVKAYNEAARRNGKLAHEGHASWLSNQKAPELIE